MVTTKLLAQGARVLPAPLRKLGKRLYYGARVPNHPAMKKFGTVQDLYYWVSDGEVDTLLLLQNYFSAFFPTLDTQTKGSVAIYDRFGEYQGTTPFSLAHCAAARFRVSSLLESLNVSPDGGFGTLEVHIDIPANVLEEIKGKQAGYFWDRFYISYVTAKGAACFVHGVDKTHIYQDGKAEPADWYGEPENLDWTPEMPVNIDEYKKFSVVMLNRTPKLADITLSLTDTSAKSLSWTVSVPPRGVHRYELTPENTSELSPHELKMRVEGMATRYGRPAVFKEFNNGAISAMHC
jgi:hypothetical protein